MRRATPINDNGVERASQTYALVCALRELRLRAGQPTTRLIAKGSGSSHTTVAETLSGKRIPSWPLVAGIVTYLDGDKERFRQLWMAATEESLQASADLEALRLDPDQLHMLQTIARANGGTVADELREAVRAHLATLRRSPEFQGRLAELRRQDQLTHEQLRSE
jgi:hypothetical protein